MPGASKASLSDTTGNGVAENSSTNNSGPWVRGIPSLRMRYSPGSATCLISIQSLTTVALLPATAVVGLCNPPARSQYLTSEGTVISVDIEFPTASPIGMLTTPAPSWDSPGSGEVVTSDEATHSRPGVPRASAIVRAHACEEAQSRKMRHVNRSDMGG